MQCLYIPSFYCLVVSTPSPSHLLQSKKLRMFIVIWNVSHAWCLYTCIHIPPPIPPLVSHNLICVCIYFSRFVKRPIWCCERRGLSMEKIPRRAPQGRLSHRSPQLGCEEAELLFVRELLYYIKCTRYLWFLLWSCGWAREKIELHMISRY